jgi:hypothetical protein
MQRGSWSTIIAGMAVAVVLASGCSSDDETSPPDEGTMVVQVFFLDEDAFNIGRPPYVSPVERTVPSTEPARAALDHLFAGPTEDERSGGLHLVTSEATGVSDLRVEDGTAHVHLEGGCSSRGSTFTVADEIAATLRQFPAVDAVKVYDPSGQTARPDSPGDSIPECLEP